MNLIEKMLRRKPKARPAVQSPFSGDVDPMEAARAAMDALKGSGNIAVQTSSHRFPKLSESVGGNRQVISRPQGREPAGPAVNVWDMDDEAADAPPVSARDQAPVRQPAIAPEEEPAAEQAPRRRLNRAKTRMLGFEPQENSVVALFDEGRKAEGEAVDQHAVVMFPTGWLVVTKGPGRGAAFPLKQGMSVIGRGSDQVVSLDFGDMAISRSNHAAIAYDPTLHQFHVGHGGKSNLVRLNGRPLLTSEEIMDGDEIQLGETTLLLKVLCTPEFNWSKSRAEGDGHDMAIA